MGFSGDPPGPPIYTRAPRWRLLWIRWKNLNAPAFQFYPGDWLSSQHVTLMTPAQEGAYIHLLCYDWDYDGLVDDDNRLAILSRLGEGWFKGGSTVVRQCFIPHPTKPGYITNKRLVEVREKQAIWREKSRLGGINSAASRSSKTVKGGSTNGQPHGSTNGQHSCLQSSSSNIKREIRGNEVRLHGIPFTEQEVVDYGETCTPPVPADVCRAFFGHYEGQRATSPNGEIFWIMGGEGSRVITKWQAKLPFYKNDQFSRSSTRNQQSKPQPKADHSKGFFGDGRGVTHQ